ncbi:MAG: TIGR04013 family B12-binding domain/radical SAM domain-containing protein [Desulfurococcales archaeon]|nr:TIGR04013 family B12-binding domain/radical SAM domain-containing protein [Desulfurococcales archaeon]
MRIALIARVISGGRNGFAHIASALEASGHLNDTVRLIIHEGDPLPVAARYAGVGFKPVVLYGLSTPLFLDYMVELRRVASRYPVVVGGPHAAGAYWHVLWLGAVAAVIGDGEPAIVGLIEYFSGLRDIRDVPNIAYREGDRYRTTRIELVDLDDYKPYSRLYSLYPPIEIMRGCQYRCTFCQVPWMFKSRVRFRSVESVGDSVKDYVRVGKRDIRFIAPIGFAYMSKDLKTPNLEALEGLLRSVVESGGRPYLGTFPSETRPELVTVDVLDLLKRYAANRRIALGLQSGSDELLDRVRRDHYVDDVFNAVEIINSKGFQAVVDFIMGLPGETDGDVEASVNAMLRLVRMGARLRLHTFLPLPGTPLARAKPRPIHPLYSKTILKLLGKGVLEGYWREQETLAKRIYCLMTYYPTPTPNPNPLPSASELCRDEWIKLENLMPREN